MDIAIYKNVSLPFYKVNRNKSSLLCQLYRIVRDSVSPFAESAGQNHLL